MTRRSSCSSGATLATRAVYVRGAWLFAHGGEAPRALPHPSERERSSRELREHGDRVPLGLEDGLRHVAEVLAVAVQRQRPVADDLHSVDVVRVEEALAAR